MSEKIGGTMREVLDRNCVRFSKVQKVYLKFKRMVDICASLCGMIVLFPVFLAVAIAIKIEDPSGTILYKQKRIGRKGTLFTLYKFRSMQADAPELSTHEFSNASAYVTRVGRFLRMSSIDELPQLWNVLIGNMSLIGPRPLLPRERNVHILRFYYGLYQVRPGITGLAQTHGRDDMNDYDKVCWDRTYVQDISLMMDLKLLWRTFIKVVVREGVADTTEKSDDTVKSEEQQIKMEMSEEVFRYYDAMVHSSK